MSQLKSLIQDYKLITAIANNGIHTNEVEDIITDALDNVKEVIQNYKITTKEEAIDKLYFVRDNVEDADLQDIITKSLMVMD